MRTRIDELKLLLDMLNSSFELLSALSKGGVEFVIIGGVALFFHGCREITEVGDLDILYAPTK